MTELTKELDGPREIRRFTITAPADESPVAGSERVRSEYVEEAWLPFIGPTALLLARRIDLALATNGKSAMDVKGLSSSLGVYPEEIIAACHRLARFGLAAWSERDPTLTLSRYWPHVPAAITTPQHKAALMALPDIGREVAAPLGPTVVQ